MEVRNPHSVIFADDINSKHRKRPTTSGTQQHIDDLIFVTHTSIAPVGNANAMGLCADSGGQATIVDLESLQPMINLTSLTTPSHKTLLDTPQPTLRKSKRPQTAFTDIHLLSDFTNNASDSNLVLFSKYKTRSVSMIDTRANRIVAEFNTTSATLPISSSDEEEDASNSAKTKSRKRKVDHTVPEGKLSANVASFATNCNAGILAVGTELIDEDAAICFWDIRGANRNVIDNGLSPLSVFYDCHSDDITSLSFHPSVPTAMASGSTDSLVCLYNLARITDEYECVHQILNTDSVSQLGFLGPSNSFVYSLSHMETFSIWRFADGDNILTMNDTRRRYNEGELCPEFKSGKPSVPESKMDYIIGCKYDDVSGRMYLIAGDTKGDISLLNVSISNGLELTHLLTGNTHSDIVRTVSWEPSRGLLMSGGEDGNLSVWHI